MKYCDTTTGNQVANRENKPYPKHKRIALLTPSCGGALFTLYQVTRRSRVILVVRRCSGLAHKARDNDPMVTAVFETADHPKGNARRIVALIVLLTAMILLNVLRFFHRGKTFSLGFPFPFATWRLPLEYEMPQIAFGPLDVFGYLLRDFSMLLLVIDGLICFGLPIWLFIRGSVRAETKASGTAT